MSKPIPKRPARIALVGDTRPLPAPLTHATIDIGYVAVIKMEYGVGTRIAHEIRTYIEVTHALVDRTFVYWVLVRSEHNPNTSEAYTVESHDVRALFIPTNKSKPKYDDGDWWYGRDPAVNYIETNAGAYDGPRGVLFVSKSAEVRWQVEGVSGAQQLHHVLRPQVSPRDATPIEFRGMYDCCVPDCCDA